MTDQTKERVETGALQIDDDWTGIFVRGDEAIMRLKAILIKAYNNEHLDEFEKSACKMLVQCIENDVDHKRQNRNVRVIKTC